MFFWRVMLADDVLSLPLGARVSVSLPRMRGYEWYRVVRWGKGKAKRLQSLKNEGFYVTVRDYEGIRYTQKEEM